MSIVGEEPKAYRKRPSRRRKDALSASRLVQPLPAPGETALVGLGDWATYERLDQALTGTGHRVRYFNGVFEIMSISVKHDALSRRFGYLIGAFCELNGMDFDAWGSATQKKQGTAGGEPDESYVFGLEPKDKPDLVIEVALSSGGIDKLDFWSVLGAKEVWIWQNDRLHGFARAAEDTFKPITTSVLLPGLSLALVQEFAVVEPSSRAVRAFREKLQAAAS